MTHDFRQDYEALGLDERADWTTARASYRRQVNLWHPDRYAQRPREGVHAQQRFIQLTRSFESLRSFHRANHRLPFEPIRTPRPPAAGADPAAERDPSGRTAPGPAERPSETAVLEAGILNVRSPKARRRRPGRLGRLIWPAAIASLVLGMLGAFLVLDRNARRATLEEGRDVLRRTAPSEYMPSAAEVQRRSSRGTFVEREDSGRIGDQLMEDVFR